MTNILYNDAEGILQIIGNSYAENAVEFYKPTIVWLKNRAKQYPDKKITIEFRMEYYNTSSSRRFLEMFDILEEHHQRGGKAEVLWLHTREDLDMQQNGADYSEEFTFPFTIGIYERF